MAEGAALLAHHAHHGAFARAVGAGDVGAEDPRMPVDDPRLALPADGHDGLGHHSHYDRGTPPRQPRGRRTKIRLAHGEPGPHRSRGRRRRAQRDAAAGVAARADRLRELRVRGRAGGPRNRLHEQVRRGLSGQALLRRLRVRRRGGEPGHRPGEGAVRLRSRQRAAALGHPGQHRGLHVGPEAGRHHPGHEPVPRRPPVPRPPAELLRPVLQRGGLRRAQGGRAHRLRRHDRARHRAPAQGDRGGGERLPADHRLRGGAPRRRRLRRDGHGRHRAHRGPGGGGAAPEPGAPRRVRHHHHPQDAARPPRRHGDVPGEVAEGARPHHLPRDPGRAAGARDRGQGGVLQGSPRARVQGLPAPDRHQRQGPRGDPHSARAGGWSPAAPTTT